MTPSLVKCASSVKKKAKNLYWHSHNKGEILFFLMTLLVFLISGTEYFYDKDIQVHFLVLSTEFLCQQCVISHFFHPTLNESLVAIQGYGDIYGEMGCSPSLIITRLDLNVESMTGTILLTRISLGSRCNAFDSRLSTESWKPCQTALCCWEQFNRYGILSDM